MGHLLEVGCHDNRQYEAGAWLIFRYPRVRIRRFRHHRPVYKTTMMLLLAEKTQRFYYIQSLCLDGTGFFCISLAINEESSRWPFSGGDGHWTLDTP